VQERDAAALFGKNFAHFFGAGRVIVKFILEQGEELVVGRDEFFAVGVADLPEVADDPAAIFKFPVVGQAHEAVVGGDIREKWELAAAQQAVRALTGLRSQAGQQDHPIWDGSFEPRAVGPWKAGLVRIRPRATRARDR
jgi:hypothetical protein